LCGTRHAGLTQLDSSISTQLKMDIGARIFIVHCDVFVMDISVGVIWKECDTVHIVTV